jgi:hypothetical protein
MAKRKGAPRNFALPGGVMRYSRSVMSAKKALYKHKKVGIRVCEQLWPLDRRCAFCAERRRLERFFFCLFLSWPNSSHQLYLGRSHGGCSTTPSRRLPLPRSPPRPSRSRVKRTARPASLPSARRFVSQLWSRTLLTHQTPAVCGLGRCWKNFFFSFLPLLPLESSVEPSSTHDSI